MPNLRALIGWIQYLPMAFELVKTLAPSPTVPETAEKTMEAIDDLRQDMHERLDVLQNEHHRLRGRMRELEAQIDTLKLLVWVSTGTTAVLLVILFIMVITLMHG